VKTEATRQSCSFRLFAGFAARVAGIGFAIRAALFQHSAEIDGIAIHGSRPFCEAVESALRRLAADAPEAFSLCKEFIETVVMSRHSGVMAKRRPAIVLLGDWVTRVSPPYLASTVVHEAYHCKLYWSHHDGEGKPVPVDVYSGEAAERQCLEYQTSVLKQRGGTETELRHLREGMATEWWKVPWHERAW